MKSRVIERWVEAHLAGRRISANSLIISVYGDLIAVHGGVVWLADLIRLMAPFGLNERVVRTSVYRLGQDDWLATGQVGRRSHYRLAASGMRRLAPAGRRSLQAGGEGWRPSSLTLSQPTRPGSISSALFFFDKKHEQTTTHRQLQYSA